MASLALRNQRAFQAGQYAWDNMEPPTERGRWIETPEGREWLDLKSGLLINGIDVVISPRVKVTAKDFIAAFGEAAADIYAYDPNNAMEWALARGLSFGGPQYQELAREIAEGMLLKHQDEAEKALAWIGDI